MTRACSANRRPRNRFWDALRPGRPKKKNSEQLELEKLRRQNEKLQADLKKTRMALDIMGKAHALLEELSESADDQISAEEVLTATFEQLRTAEICGAAGVHADRDLAGDLLPQAKPVGPMHGPWLPRTPPPQTLSPAEREQVLAVLNAPAYTDLAIPQVWARELDEGRYWCSMSTMYRIARAAGQSRERRRQATHPPRVRPELVATGPSQVWSWDITALKGPVKGVWFKCYVIIDIFSRYVTGWLVAAAEDAIVARDFLADAVTANGIEPHTIHADRGGAMTSKPVSEMLVDLGVLRSHSRPRTSNDNPYSEAQFKTMKYMPDFPDRFGSLADARDVLRRVLHRLQPRTPPLRDRLAHARLRALRHRRPDPRAPPDHPRRRLRPAPRPVHPPAQRTPTPRAGLDQPANNRGTNRLNLT